MDTNSTDVAVTVDIAAEVLRARQLRLRQLIASLRSPIGLRYLSLAVAIFGVVFGILGNGTAIHFFRKRLKKNATNVFLFSLAVIDLCVSSVLLPCLPALVFHSEKVVTSALVRTVQKVWSYLLTFFTLMSIAHLDLIAIDRFRSICFALKSKISFRMSVLLILLATFFSAALTLLFVYLKEVSQTDKPLFKAVILPQSFGCIVIVVLYFRMFNFLRTRKLQVGAMKAAPGSKTSRQTTSTSHGSANDDQQPVTRQQTVFTTKSPSVKLLRTMVVVTAFFLAGYIPVYAVALSTRVPPYVVFSYVVNHLANPVIYYCLDSAFKGYALGLVDKFCSRLAIRRRDNSSGN